MKTIRLIFIILFSLESISYAQPFPPPIDLGIQNIPQKTSVWCWAAVAQQIILATKGANATPPQCAMVAIANGANPQMCCQMPQNCMVTGSLQEIQGLIAHFGGHFSSIAPPTNPISIYNTLSSGKAIIMAVKSSPYSAHVVVIRGIRWIHTQFGVQPVLYINDPMAYFTQPVLFQNIAAYWQAAIIVY